MIAHVPKPTMDWWCLVDTTTSWPGSHTPTRSNVSGSDHTHRDDDVDELAIEATVTDVDVAWISARRRERTSSNS